MVKLVNLLKNSSHKKIAGKDKGNNNYQIQLNWRNEVYGKAKKNLT